MFCKDKKNVKWIWEYVRWSAIDMWPIALLVGCLQLLKQVKGQENSSKFH